MAIACTVAYVNAIPVAESKPEPAAEPKPAPVAEPKPAPVAALDEVAKVDAKVDDKPELKGEEGEKDLATASTHGFYYHRFAPISYSYGYGYPFPYSYHYEILPPVHSHAVVTKVII